MEKKYISFYQELFNGEGYATELFDNPEEYPTPFLIVDLGQDVNGRQRLLRIFAEEQEMGNELIANDVENVTPIVYLELKLEYPFPVNPLYSKELASLLAFLNDQLKVSSFGMNELNQRVYYRYHMFSTETGVNSKVLMSIVGLILLFYDLYGIAIEQVATGKMTFNEMMEKVVETLS